jgi:hypothetical protein
MKITFILKKALILPCYFCITSLFVQQPAVFATDNVAELNNRLHECIRSFNEVVENQRSELRNALPISLDIKYQIGILAMLEATNSIPQNPLSWKTLVQEELNDQNTESNAFIERMKDLIKVVEQQKLDAYEQANLLEILIALNNVQVIEQAELLNWNQEVNNKAEELNTLAQNVTDLIRQADMNGWKVLGVKCAMSQILGEQVELPMEQRTSLEQGILEGIEDQQLVEGLFNGQVPSQLVVELLNEQVEILNRLLIEQCQELDGYFEQSLGIKTQMGRQDILEKKNLIPANFAQHIKKNIEKNQANINAIIENQINQIDYVLLLKLEVDAQIETLNSFGIVADYGAQVTSNSFMTDISNQRSILDIWRQAMFNLRLQVYEHNETINQYKANVAEIINSIGNG